MRERRELTTQLKNALAAKLGISSCPKSFCQ